MALALALAIGGKAMALALALAIGGKAMALALALAVDCGFRIGITSNLLIQSSRNLGPLFLHLSTGRFSGFLVGRGRRRTRAVLETLLIGPAYKPADFVPIAHGE